MFALAIAVPLTLGLVACGGGDSTGSTSTAATGATPEPTGTASGENRGASKGEKQSGDHNGGAGEGSDSAQGSSPSAEKGSASFRTPGGDNSIQNFGDEADATEAEAVSTTLAAFLQARAKDDWAGECAYLAKATMAPLEQLASSSPQLRGKDCAGILAALASGTPTSIRQNTLSGGIASLRVQGNHAFALYHGPAGTDYFVPMTHEDGKWKVGALAPSEFP